MLKEITLIIFVVLVMVTLIWIMFFEIPDRNYKEYLKEKEFCESRGYEIKIDRGLYFRMYYVEYCSKVLNETIEKRFVETVNGEAYWVDKK